MRTRYWFVLAMGVWVSGCGVSPPGDLFGSTGASCSPGITSACVGANTCAGLQICTPDGTPGQCMCPPASGGASSVGGAASSGGFSGASGGASGGGSTSGGEPGVGGSPSVGGAPSVGGSPNVGGMNGLGGASGFGGAPSSGGAPGVGGSGSGGFTSTGGSGGASTGGTPANGGNGGGSFLDASTDASRPPPVCGEGSYTGTLDGPYTTGNSTSQFVAHIAFTITATGAISGTLTGTSNPTGRATLSGKLNCSTNEASIAITNGKYTAGMGATFTYTGTMSGVYVPETISFPGGSWTITEPNSSSGGRGSWSAAQ